MQKRSALLVGASELGTACVLRLFRAGIQILILEKDSPLDIYHSRSFSSAAFSGMKSIENIVAKTFAKSLDEGNIKTDSNIIDFIKFSLQNREIPMILESDASYLSQLVIDYIIICNLSLYETVRGQLSADSVSIGFEKEIDSDNYNYTICNTGPHFGRVLYAFDEPHGPDDNFTIKKKDKFEQVKAPLEGVFQSSKTINELVHEKEEIGKINEIPILSPVLGRINGILNSGVIIPAGAVFVEIDTSHSGFSAHVLSKDSICLSGAVLEGIMYDIRLNE